MFSTVRVIDKNTPASYLWGLRLSKISFWLMFLSIIGIIIFSLFGSYGTNWVNGNKSLEWLVDKSDGVFEIQPFVWGLVGLFVILTIIFLSIFCFSFWLMKLDKQFSKSKNDKLQAKLKKYEYKLNCKVEKKQKTKSNKILKKEMLANYKKQKQ